MAKSDLINAPVAAQYVVRRYFAKGALLGDEQMTVNGSVTPVHFDLVPTVGKSMAISMIAIDIRGSSMPANSFGAIAPLTNGLLIHLLDDQDVFVGAFLQDVMYPTGKPIKTNADLIELFDGAPVRDQAQGGGGLGDILAVMTFFNDELTGGPMLLPAGYKLRAIVQDDLSAIDSLTMHVRGYEFD